jgi:hypothetical protein
MDRKIEFLSECIEKAVVDQEMVMRVRGRHLDHS